MANTWLHRNHRQEDHRFDISDEYQYMDEELVESIKTPVSPYLDNV